MPFSGRADARAPFAALDEARGAEAAFFEGGADFGGLAHEDSREDKMPAGLEFFGKAGSGGDEEFAVEIREDDIGLLKRADALGVGDREGDFPTAIGLGVFFGNPDADGIEVEGFHRRGTEFLRRDGKNPCASAGIERPPASGEMGNNIAKKAQTCRRRCMVAGPKSHAGGNENVALGVCRSAEGGVIRVDSQTPPNGKRRSGLTFNPRLWSELRHFPSEVADQLLDGFLVAENLDFQRAGFGLREHDQMLGIDVRKSRIPILLHPLRAQASPSMHCHGED